jgi:integrase/recombinase XerD
MDESAKLRTGIDLPGLKQSEQCPTATLLLDYIRTKGEMCDGHVIEVKRVLQSWSLAVPNLMSPGAKDQTNEWYRTLEGSLSTRRRKLATVKAVSKWAYDQEVTSTDPLRSVKLPRLPNSLKPQFSLDELRKMATAYRDPYYLRFCFQFFTALRCSEAHQLDWTRVNTQDRLVAVYESKWGRDRMVPIMGEFAYILRGRAQDSGPVFGERERRISTKQMGLDFEAFTGRLGIDLHAGGKKRTPHSLRHCYAGLMTATGENSFVIMENMGHEDASTTKHYAAYAKHYINRVKAEKWERGEFRLLR